MKVSFKEIEGAACAWIGTPYRHQASKLGVGCDCLGLVRGVWRALYGAEQMAVPPYAQFGRDVKGAHQLLQAARLYLQPLRDGPQPGSVVLFQLHKKLPPRHCGIVLQDNYFIHAQERLGVIKIRLDRNWSRRIHSTYCFPDKV